MKRERQKIAGSFCYNTEDILGSGSWGTVFKAKNLNEKDKKQYALKKINKFKI